MRFAIQILIIVLLGCKEKKIDGIERLDAYSITRTVHYDDIDISEITTISHRLYNDSALNPEGEIISGNYTVCAFIYLKDFKDSYDAFVLREVMIVIKDLNQIPLNQKVVVPNSNITVYFKRMTAWSYMPPQNLTGEIVFLHLDNNYIKISIVERLQTSFSANSRYSGSASFSGDHKFVK